MAEFVEFRTEEMVPELEQLEKYRIFNEAEIRTIIRTRKKFQYKIQRLTKHLEDYVRYLQYEMDLLRLVKIRRKKLGLTEKKHAVDLVIAQRVNKLFEQALIRFKDDINLWLSYMKFCKQIKIFKVNVSNKLIAMLAVHSSQPSLWKLAANWEFEENNSIENAFQFIMRGLRHHPSSKMLFEEAFRLELIYAEKKHKEVESKNSNQEKKEVVPCASTADPVSSDHEEAMEVSNSGGQPSQRISQNNLLQWQDAIHDPVAFASAVESDSVDPVLDCQNAKFIYENAVKKIDDAQFLISLLNIAKHFDFTDKLQSAMMKDLLHHFPNDEVTWDTLARLELEGVHFISNTEEDKLNIEDSMSRCGAKTETEKLHYKRIRQCFSVYQQGLKQLNTKRMWDFYLNAFMEMNEDPKVLKKVKRKLLVSAFQSAQEAGYLQEKHYVHWINMRGVDREMLSVVLLKATEDFPTSAELWQMRLNFHVLEGHDQSVMDVFKCATAALGCNASALSIWKMVIQYWETKSVDRVKELFEKGMKEGPVVASALKQMYLHWLVSVKSIQSARKVYDTVCSEPPFCWDLHKKMIELECVQPKVNMPRVTKCYELACGQFGKSDPDIWMDYIKFETKRGDPKKVKDIYQRAFKTLDKELTQQFMSDFCEYWAVHKLDD